MTPQEAEFVCWQEPSLFMRLMAMFGVALLAALFCTLVWLMGVA